MATDFLNTPHPYLHSPLLYIVDVPKRVKWPHLLAVFKPCGAVTSRGKCTVMTSRGQLKRWAVAFADVFHAEMALATLQGAAVPGVDPPFSLELSYSPLLAKATPEDPLLPQFVKGTGFANEIHPLQNASAQEIFTWFRHAGPLVSVHVNQDVGYSQPTCVVRYWDIPHAQLARTKCKTLHPALKDMPPFSLRTHDPRNLYCARLGESCTEALLWVVFSKFGQIIEGQMKKLGVPDAFGFVAFATEEQAADAMKSMNGTQVDGQDIVVRFHEPGNQALFRLPSKAQQASSPEHGPEATKATRAEEEKREQEEKARRDREAKEEAQRKAKEEEQRKVRDEEQRKTQEKAQRRAEKERLQREAETREAARRVEQNRLRRAAAKDKREKAEEAAKAARAELQEATSGELATRQKVETAEQTRLSLKQEFSEAEEAVQEAMQALEAAKARRSQVVQGLLDALHVKNEAMDLHRSASVRLKAATERDAQSSADHEAAQREEQDILKSTELPDEEAKKREEERRQQELAESIRKMKEMREQEEADRQEKFRRERERKAEEERQREAERLAQEEKERKEREEEERKARELLEKEQAEARRLQAYRDASQREITRCKDRDNVLWSRRTLWTKERAVARFKVISAEFDSLKFCDAQPLTFESIPWPLTHSPHFVTLDNIEWSAVEEFFEATQLVVSAEEYRGMVEKAHRRFHPDKWRARGLLLTVLDEELKKRLEDAGNIVAQAITPIWLANKAKK